MGTGRRSSPIMGEHGAIKLVCATASATVDLPVPGRPVTTTSDGRAVLAPWGRRFIRKQCPAQAFQGQGRRAPRSPHRRNRVRHGTAPAPPGCNRSMSDSRPTWTSGSTRCARGPGSPRAGCSEVEQVATGQDPVERDVPRLPQPHSARGRRDSARSTSSAWSGPGVRCGSARRRRPSGATTCCSRCTRPSGHASHNEQRRGPEALAEAVAEVGWPLGPEAATSTEFDEGIKASHQPRDGLVGLDVGTPIITVGGHAFFGPVAATPYRARPPDDCGTACWPSQPPTGSSS